MSIARVGRRQESIDDPQQRQGCREGSDWPAATSGRLVTAAARDSGAHRFTTVGGVAAMSGALLAVAGNAVVFASRPNAPSGVVSYPLSAGDFRMGQVFFALTQALMTLGIVALVRSEIAGIGRRARIGAWLAIMGFAVTILGELVLALVADAPTDSTRASAASSVFGIGVLFADVGLILFGIAAFRAGSWPKIWAALPVVFGVFQLLMVTPVTLTAGFASAAALVVIAVQDILMALIGFRLVRYQPHRRLLFSGEG